jgi:superfamily II DNA or RNA helicase
MIVEGDDLPYYFLSGNVPGHALAAIDANLSYKPANYERTQAYQRGEWDGRVRLFRKTRSGASWYFPAGLLGKVTEALDAFGVEYEIQRQPEKRFDPIGIEWVSDIKLRNYQEEVVKTAYAARGGVISLPTGAGKTIIALKLMQMYNVPTLILVHTKELLLQWKQEIKTHLGIDAGIVGDGEKDWRLVTVAMLQTVGGMLKRGEVKRLEFGMMVLDETHRVAADMAYSIAMACTARIRYGMSATPRRTDNKDLKIFAATGPITSNLTPCDLIRAGYLAKLKLTIVSVGAPASYFSTEWNKEYVTYIVANEDRNEKIVSETERLVSEGKQVYIHVERLDHLKLLYNALVPVIGADKVARVYGRIKTSDRQASIRRFEKGDIKVLIGTILKEGVNLPAMDAVVLAGGLSSPVALVQKVGRALRRNDRFDYAEIIDFSDNFGRFCKKHAEMRYQAFMEYYGKCIEIVYG